MDLEQELRFGTCLHACVAQGKSPFSSKTWVSKVPFSYKIKT